MSRPPRERLLEEARRAAEALASLGRVHCVILVGSVARGDHGPLSDLDLAVVVEGGVGYGDYYRMKALVASLVDAPVDLIVLGLDDLRRHAARKTKFHGELLAGVALHATGKCAEALRPG